MKDIEFNDGTFIESNEPKCNKDCKVTSNNDWPKGRNTSHAELMILQHISEQETNKKPDP